MSTQLKRYSLTTTQAFLSVIGGLVVSASAQAHGLHAHGRADLTVAVEAKNVSVRAQIPQESVVGFERAPSSDKEKASASAAIETLKQGAKMIVLSESAACTLQSTKVDAPLLIGDKASASTAAVKQPAAKAEMHADVVASYEFICAKPEALGQITVNLFDSFKGIKVVQVQFALAAKTGARQKTARLVASARTAKF